MSELIEEAQLILDVSFLEAEIFLLERRLAEARKQIETKKQQYWQAKRVKEDGT